MASPGSLMPDGEGSRALLDCWSRWGGGVDCGYSRQRWSAAQLRDHTDRLARELSRHGLRESDVVAVVVGNGASFPVVLFSLLMLDCNPLLLHATTTQREIARLAQSLGLRSAVLDTAGGLAELSAGWSHAGQLSAAPTPLALIRNGRADAQQPPGPRLAGVVLHPTSGTSGRSRFCIRNQRVAVAEGENYVTSINAYSGVRIAITTPLSHAFAYGFGLVASLITDSTLVVDRVFNPKKLLRYLAADPCDILTIVPPMVQPLIHLKTAAPSARLPEIVFYAGSNCHESIAAAFRQEFNVQLYAIYGSTETGAISTNFEPGGCDRGVGHALNNVEVEVRNQGRYRSLRGGQAGVGEVFVRSTSMMQGYWGEAQTVGTDGWFPPGDVGFLDSNGDIHLVGRTREMINVGGLKVDPGEVESVLQSHPAVRDVAVYPGQDQAGNEITVAAVQPFSEPPDEDELRRHCNNELTAWKVPVVFHIVSEIPRTPSGKCLKYRLPGCSTALLPD